DVTLLENVNIESYINEPEVGQPYNLNLSLSGSGLADVELINTDRVAAFSIPELAGQMTSNGEAYYTVDLTAVNMDDLPILNNTVSGITGTLTTTVDAVLQLVVDLNNSIIPNELITIRGIEDLQGSLNALNNLDQALAEVLQHSGTAPVIINADGT